MTLNDVTQANARLQADPKAALSVKKAVGEIVRYLTPPDPAPQTSERYLDLRPGSGHLVLGEAPNGTAAANSTFNGPNIRTLKASDENIDTLQGWDAWLELTLGPNQSVPGGGRFMISAMGMDPAEPGYPGGNPSSNTPAGYFNGYAWHHHGQTYTYLLGLRVPKAMVPMIGPSMICTVAEFTHADAVIDGAWPTSFYPISYHGHNATGILLAANRPGLVQQFTPRPGDGYLPPLADRTPQWAFKMGFGDVTTHDNIATWALQPVVGDETVWFACELTKGDTAGAVNLWTRTKSQPLTQRVAYLGSTNQHVAGTAMFDPQNPRSNAADSPQRLEGHPCFGPLAPMIYNGSVNPPAPFKVQSPGSVRYVNRADALAVVA